MTVRHEQRRDADGHERWYWIVDVDMRFPDGSRRRERRVCPVQTKRGAETYERQLREEMLNPSAPTPKKEVPTLSKFSEEFITTYAVVNNKPSEVRMKRSVFKHHLLPMFGTKRLDEIGPRHIEGYKAKKLAEGLSKATVNNHLTMLRKSLNIAHEWGVIESVPKIKWLKLPKPEFDFLDFEESERLIAAADDHWRTFVVTALRTGLRFGELTGLRWDDVDLTKGLMVVRQSNWRGQIGTPKSGKTREIPLSEQARVALRSYRHLKGELVFSDAKGEFLTEGECKWPLIRACKRAGLRKIGWHALRHTFASQLVMRGVPLKAVQELLGHATMEMTMRYAHLSPEVRRDAVMVLDLPVPSGVAQVHGNLTATEQSSGA